MGSLLDAVLPLRCAACARPAPRGLCQRCAAAAERLVLPDAGWEELDEGVAAIGLFAHDGVAAEAVRGLKLGGRHAGAGPLGALLRQRLPLPAGWPVTWVPSTRRRLRERGFELTRELAGPGAGALLDRVADRPDQTSLTATGRRAAPLGAFRPRGAVPPAVVLVDDVRTTGATALACADALRDGGAARVLVLTLTVGGEAARRAVDR